MRATLAMTVNDLRIMWGQPAYWVSLTLLPILFTVVIGFAFGVSAGPQLLRVEVLDFDRSAASEHLIRELAGANDALVICGSGEPAGAGADEGDDRCGNMETDFSLEAAQARVREGGRAALIIIPTGYEAASATNNPTAIEFYSLTPPMMPDVVLGTLDRVVQRLNHAALSAAIADAIVVRAGTGTEPEPGRAEFVAAVFRQSETLLAERAEAVHFTGVGGRMDEAGAGENRGGQNASMQGFAQSVPGMGSMYVMFTVFGGMILIQRERQRWTLQRLAVFPLTRGQILGGKIFTYFFLGMLQFAVVFAVGLVVGLDFGPTPWLVLPVMVAFVLCCTSLTFALAPSLRSESQANAVVQLLSLTLAALGGAWWPLEIVPGFMQRIGYLSPVAWAMSAFRDLLFFGGGLGEIAPEVGVLVGAAVALFGIGIWRFRYV